MGKAKSNSKCTICGNKISQNARMCPRCGEPTKKSKMGEVLLGIIIAVIGAVAGAAIVGAWTLSLEIMILSKDVSDLKTQVADLRRLHLSDKENHEEEKTISLVSEVFFAANSGGVMTDVSLLEPELKGEDTVAVSNDGTEYSAGELVGKRVCLWYEGVNGEDCFFAGQYNENGQWDGDCLINVYRDGKLFISMKDYYENGVRTKYEQAICDDSKEEYVSNKMAVVDGETSGDIWRFNKYEKGGSVCLIRQKVKKEEPHEEDMVTPAWFKKYAGKNLAITTWYEGRIADDKSDDQTGDAFLVKYFEDKTVRMLYQGTFISGEMERGWEIATEEGSQWYIFYEGNFENGKAKGDSAPIDKEGITAKIDGRPYASKLKWRQ